MPRPAPAGPFTSHELAAALTDFRALANRRAETARVVAAIVAHILRQLDRQTALRRRRRGGRS